MESILNPTTPPVKEFLHLKFFCQIHKFYP